MDADALLDREQIDGLRDELGAEDFAEVTELFMEEIETALTRLPPVVDAAAVHALKGLALNMGFKAMAEVCAEAEAAGRSPDQNVLSTLFHRSRDAIRPR